MKQIEFTCSLSGKPRPLPHVWEHTVGSGHAPLALRADWQRQLRRCHEQLGFRHVRFHDILSDDMGTLMDEQDQLLYSFFNADQICDFLLSIEIESVHVALGGISSPRNAFIERIDHDHANAKRLWIDMGKPDLPTEREVEQLHVASEIVRELLPWICDAGTLHLEFTMPPHAIAAISVELPPQQPARKPGS